MDLLTDGLPAGAVEHAGEALVMRHLEAEERELGVSVQYFVYIELDGPAQLTTTSTDPYRKFVSILDI